MSVTVEGRDLIVRPLNIRSEEIKRVLGGRWDKSRGVWKLPATALNALTLEDWYGEDFFTSAPQPIQDLLYEDWGFKGFSASKELRKLAIKHPRWKDLYPFQKDAVEYLTCNTHRGALLGLSPGLGKTPVTIVAADVLQCEKILIVAPLTLAKNWGKELDNWSQYDRQWHRATAQDKDPISDVTITNFETLYEVVFRDEEGNVLHIPGGPKAQKEWILEGPHEIGPSGKTEPVRQRIVQARQSYFEVDWDLIVIDESILLKNRKAVKAKVLQQLAKYSKEVWLLSGSPTAKYRDDLFKQLSIIQPKVFSSYWRFTEFFCIVERGQWGWSVQGDRPDHDPQEYLKDFMFIRNQKDVLPDLPDYIYDPIDIELNKDQAKAFKEMVDEWVVYLELESELEEDPDIVAANRLAQIVRMQQITSNMCNLEKAAGKPMKSSSAKEDLLVDLIKNSEIELPLLVWAWWVPTAKSIANRLEQTFKGLRVGLVVGEMKSEDKDATLEGYKSGSLDVLVLQMGVGKFGHTLTNTKTVFYHDRSFDSDAYVQSLKRVKRIGLEHKPRLITPRAPLSADPIIELNLAGKMQSISKVASHNLLELLSSLGSIEWSLSNAD